MEAINIQSRLVAMLSIVLLACLPKAHAESFGDSAISEKITGPGIPDFIALQESSDSRITAIDNLIEKINAFNTVVPETTAELVRTASANDPGSNNGPKSEESGKPKPINIASEAIPSCRMPGVIKNAPNFKRLTEYECACELIKRSPGAKDGGASEDDFHWYTQCKKSRYTVSFYQSEK